MHVLNYWKMFIHTERIPTHCSVLLFISSCCKCKNDYFLVCHVRSL